MAIVPTTDRWRAPSKASKSKKFTTKNTKHANRQHALPLNTSNALTIHKVCIQRTIAPVQLSKKKIEVGIKKDWEFWFRRSRLSVTHLVQVAAHDDNKDDFDLRLRVDSEKAIHQFFP